MCLGYHFFSYIRKSKILIELLNLFAVNRVNYVRWIKLWILDENDAYNQNEYYEYDMKYDPENKNENPEYWDRKKRIKWNVMLFFGCMLLYSTRTSLSICVSRMSKDYGWDKRISVSCEIVVSRIQTLRSVLVFSFISHGSVL